ncbi:betaine--homocysteine S-methyltransferase 1-like isoform X2 [Branchiostoma floridae x Branchiostoma belcheri]
MATKPKGLLDRLKAGETVICAEGYLFEFERRGYLKAGPFAPEVVVDHPELVRGLHREFAHAGSDVVLAFTEQTEWAVAEGADFMVAETFHNLGEALLALDSIKQFGNGLAAVVSFSVPREGLWDGHTVEEAMLALEKAGAAVVGLNCGRGPATMLPLMEGVVEKVKVPFAALPVVYRTNEQQPTMHSLINHKGSKAFIVDMDEFLCGRTMVADFGQRCKDLGVQYVGLCCGNAPHFTRTLAETMGRTPPASKYSPDMTKHFTYGTDRWYGNKSL